MKIDYSLKPTLDLGLRQASLLPVVIRFRADYTSNR
jgi:hypothetical protein